MSVTTTLTEVLASHVVLEVEGIDRKYLNAALQVCTGNRAAELNHRNLLAFGGATAGQRRNLTKDERSGVPDRVPQQ